MTLSLTKTRRMKEQERQKRLLIRRSSPRLLAVTFSGLPASLSGPTARQSKCFNRQVTSSILTIASSETIRFSAQAARRFTRWKTLSWRTMKMKKKRTRMRKISRRRSTRLRAIATEKLLMNLSVSMKVAMM